MTTWNELKKEIQSIKPTEVNAIDSLAYLHSQRIKLGLSQKELAKRIGMN